MLLETFTFHHIVTSFHNGVVWLIMSDICFVVKAFFESLCTSLIELNEDWCDEVCNITNESQPPSNLEKHQYFYTKDLISFLHFKK